MPDAISIRYVPEGVTDPASQCRVECAVDVTAGGAGDPLAGILRAGRVGI